MDIYLPPPITTDETKVEMSLTPMESKFLALLVRNQGRIVTHKQIAFEVIGEPNELLAPDCSRPLCSRLRKKIGSDKIATVRGRGYIYL